MDKSTTIENIITTLTAEEKAGQLMVVDFAGITVTPHHQKLITKYHVAGLRVQPNARIKGVYHHGALDADLMRKRSYRAPRGGTKDLAEFNEGPRVTAAEYAATLNRLKELAMNRRVPVPLHATIDQEGTGFENFNCGDVRLFPTQMGMAAIENESTVSQAYKVFARQLVGAGINWIHSPVLDVNTNPKNLEVGLRSFSDRTDVVKKMGLIMLHALTSEGLIATAKHFPGRGPSEVDAHLDLPVIDLSAEALIEDHVAPYEAVIEAGLPAVMIAHTVYPALDGSRKPATISHQTITKTLRNELGFDGAITTDNLLMNGMIKEYEIGYSAVEAIKAGATLLLPRAESHLMDEVHRALVDAIRSGDLPEETVDDAIRRNLSVKFDYGLFENGGIVEPEAADRVQKAPESLRWETAAAVESVHLLRDDGGILPLSRRDSLLLVDQTADVQRNMNNFHCHPGVFWESLLKHHDATACVELGPGHAGAEDRQRVLRRLPEADTIILTSHHPHKQGAQNNRLVEEIVELCRRDDKRVLMVTNSPYQVPESIGTVLVTYSGNTASMRQAADILFGVEPALGGLPVSNSQP